MLKHYILISLRGLARNKTSTSINIFGLSLSILILLLSISWSYSELKVDTFHENDDRLFTVMQNYSMAGNIITSNSTPALLYHSVQEEFPEVMKAVAVSEPLNGRTSRGVLTYGKKSLKADEIYATASFFNIFSYKHLHGSLESTFSDLNSVAISRELAEKLFSRMEEAVGKQVSWKQDGSSGNYLISGVYDIPESSSERFDLVFNFRLLEQKSDLLKSWGNNGPTTYLLLGEKSNPEQVSTKLGGFLKEKVASYENHINTDFIGTLFLEKYSRGYLYDQYTNGVQDGGRIEYMRLAMIISLIILILTAINYINLATARGGRKYKEIVVKNSLGATPGNFFFQFFLESFLLVICAGTIAILLFYPVGKMLSSLFEISVLPPQFDINSLLVVFGVLAISSLLVGIYPSLKLAKMGVNKLGVKRDESHRRSALVVFQFLVSTGIITSALIVHNQLNYVTNRDLGYNPSTVLKVKNDASLKDQMQAFLQEVSSIPQVVETSTMLNDFTGDHWKSSGVEWDGMGSKSRFGIINVGMNFFKLMEIELLEGRAFSEEFNESENIIINETAAKIMGLESPLGSTIRLWGSDRQVVGVTPDFHIDNLREQIKPMLILHSEQEKYGLIKLSKPDIDTYRKINELYRNQHSGLNPEITFLRDDIQGMYKTEERISRVSKVLSGVIIIISCLGLLGLTIYETERRVKEIGIRKVLGASFQSILGFFSRKMLLSVWVGVSLSVPLSYYLMSEWMSEFTYRLDLSFWFFLAPLILTVALAGITIGANVSRVASINPAQSLRSE